MARVSYSADVLRIKAEIGQRLRVLRIELAGEQDYAVFTKRMGIPLRSWYQYEHGVSIPADVILRVIEGTSVEPMWLLHGREPRFRQPEWPLAAPDPRATAAVVIRAALELLDLQAEPGPE